MADTTDTSSAFLAGNFVKGYTGLYTGATTVYGNVPVETEEGDLLIAIISKDDSD